MIHTQSIKNLRKEAKLKQVCLAKRLGVSTATYSKKERGAIKFSLNEAYELAQIFNRSIEEIFFTP